MEKQIVEQIKLFIERSRNDEALKDLHKTAYVRGYNRAIEDIENIITLAESLKKGS